MLLIYHFQKFSALGKLFIFTGCLLIGGNIRDVVGSGLFGYFENRSVYSFGAVILLAAVFMLRKKRMEQRERV
jgi:hypothetical protein